MSDQGPSNGYDDGAPRSGGGTGGNLAPQELTPSDADTGRTAGDRRDEDVVDAAFSGLDNDLVKVDGFDGDGPAGRQDNGGSRVASDAGSTPTDEDVDETSAGGLQYPDDVPTSGAGRS